MGLPWQRWRAPLLGTAAASIVFVVDLFGSSAIVLIPLLVVGPLVAATGDGPKWTLGVGAFATALAVPLGWIDDMGGSGRHVVGVAVNVLGTVFAWRLAVSRDRRERALQSAAPALARAMRLNSAMHAGRLGDWWWDQASGAVGWDAQVSALFGLQPDEFDGTFDAWVARIDERDRDMVIQAVNTGVANVEAFRFDHRCVWPDGSTHWVEGIGEVTVEDGVVTGAVGIAFDVDERHRELDERTHLADIERRARLRAEYVARMHGVLSTSLEVGEILDRVTNSVVPDLADWCSAVLAVDRPRADPLIVAAHHDEQMRAFALEVRRRYPYDPDADWGAAKVIRTGQREVLAGLSTYRVDTDDQQLVLDRIDVDSVVTVAIVGPLGVLGSLQLIRGRNRPAFDDDEIELIEELTTRCGAALHIAILFARQATSRSALDTLQRVSGGLAGAVTRHDVARAVIAHGTTALRAEGAALFVRVGDGVELVGDDGLSSADTSALEELAVRALSDEAVINTTVELAHGGAALVTPLRMMSRSTGALAFVFAEPRTFADDEVSMMVTLAARCAGALERAQLYERERATALVLQRRLLPDMTTVPDWLDVAARYEPAAGGQIGGDWYQFVEGAPGALTAVVGDAVGHGVASAAAMGQLRASIATAVSSDLELDAAIRVVDTFAAQGMDTLAASAAFAQIDQAGGVLYGLAGHPPLVLIPAQGPVRLLEKGRRPLLGFSHSVLVHPVSQRELFGPGDKLVMYTDGLVERRGENIDEGLDRLMQAIQGSRQLPPAALCDELIMQLAGQQRDDIAVVVIGRR